MALHQGAEFLFDADLRLERRDWTPREIRRALASFPLHTFKVIAAIHWEALKLWLKRVPVFTKPKPSSLAPVPACSPRPPRP
jgi:DUF1365 family protein